MEKIVYLIRTFNIIPKAPGVFGSERSNELGQWLLDTFAIAEHLGYQGMLGDVNAVYVSFRERNKDGLGKFSFSRDDVRRFYKLALCVEHQLSNCINGKRWKEFCKKHKWALE